MSANGVIAPRKANSAQGGDSIGCGRTEAIVPIRRRDRAMLGEVRASDLYLSGTRKAIIKWHDGFHILETRAYRGYWTVRIRPLIAGGPSWVAAADVDLRTIRVHRIRGIGTAYMAFLHRTRTEAEVTIDRFLYARGDRSRAS